MMVGCSKMTVTTASGRCRSLLLLRYDEVYREKGCTIKLFSY